MNISRIALLSVIFSAPILSSETPPTPVVTQSTLSKITAFPANAFWAIFATAPDAIANRTITPYLLNPIANNISFLNFEALSKKEQNFIGRAAVLVAAALIARKAYVMLNSAQDTIETDEDDFFNNDLDADDINNN